MQAREDIEMTKDHESNNFEGDLLTLEKIVDELSSGELSLDASLKKFEEGVKMFKNCKKTLGKVEKKIKILTDELKEENFD